MESIALDAFCLKGFGSPSRASQLSEATSARPLSAQASARSSESLGDLFDAISDGEGNAGADILQDGALGGKRERDEGASGDANGGIPDELNFDAPRKKVKYRHSHSRIARPRDSMPGFRRNRGGGGRSGRRGGRGRFSSRGGITNVGSRHLDRGSSASAYYGGSALGAGDDASTKEVDPVVRDVADMDVPVCSGHGVPCKRVITARGPNKGRPFYTCAQERRFERCGFFTWADEQPTAGVCDHDAEIQGAGTFKIPPAVTSEDIDVDEAARKHFGIENLRSEQRSAVERLRSGSSVLAVFPTGGGKSLVYQLFSALVPGVLLVVTPLVALMRDQEERMPDCLPCACLRGAQSRAEAEKIEKRLREGQLKVLLVSPERLTSQRFRNLVHAAGKKFFAGVVVDEAHCVSEWSHNFRTAYLRLARLLFGGANDALFGTNVPVCALTATATSITTKGICEALHIDPDEGVMRTDISRHNLELGVSHVRGNAADAKLHELVRLLTTEPYATVVRAGLNDDNKNRKKKKKEEDQGWGESAKELTRKARPKRGRRSNAGSVLVYVSKQRTCETAANFLKTSNLAFGRTVAAYHAGLPSHQREKVQSDFQAGRICVLVATVAFGMGLNVPNVRAVVHFDPPPSLEAYAQEAGRAGRDGHPARCHALVAGEDPARLVSRAHADGVEACTIRKFVSALCSSASEAGDKVILCITHDALAEVHDLRPETAETVVALLERAVPGVELLRDGHTTLVAQFFAHPPETLLAEPRVKALNDREQRVVRALSKGSRVKNGSHVLTLLSAGLLEEDALAGLHKLAKADAVKLEYRDKALRVRCTPEAAERLKNESQVHVANAAAVLARIERTRVRKATAVRDAYAAAEQALSVPAQSAALHAALSRYFDGSDDVETDSDVSSTELDAKHTASLNGAIGQVLGCRAFGRRAPRTPREVARIMHGIQSAAFTAKAWYGCRQWGKWTHVPFEAVKAATTRVIKARVNQRRS